MSEQRLEGLRGGIILALAILSLATDAIAGEMVKVRIQKHQPGIQVSGFGLLFQANNQSHILNALPTKQTAKVSGQKIGNETYWIVKTESKEIQLTGRRLYIKGDILRVGKKLVPNKLEIFARKNSEIDVLAHMDIEKYLEGVLPSEMPAAWPLESLKAQAIVSRSYALYIKSIRRGYHYDLDSNIEDQVFELSNHRNAGTFYQKKIAQALNSTKGIYLMDSSNNPYPAFYHADCGGQTEEPDEVWNNGLSNGTVKDPSCPLSPLGEWQQSYSKKLLSKKLRNHFKVKGHKPLNAFYVTERSKSGRVSKINVEFQGGPIKSLSAQSFRQVMGFKTVKSANFQVFLQNDQLILEGKGHGHGVGLCQWGTRFFAMRGLGFQEVLRHYFPKSELNLPKKMSPLSVDPIATLKGLVAQ